MSDHLFNATRDQVLVVKIINFTCHEWPLQIKIADRSSHGPNLIGELSSAEDQYPLLLNLIGTADLIWSIIIKLRELSLPFESILLYNHSTVLAKRIQETRKTTQLPLQSSFDHFRALILLWISFWTS